MVKGGDGGSLSPYTTSIDSQSVHVPENEVPPLKHTPILLPATVVSKLPDTTASCPLPDAPVVVNPVAASA